MKAFKNFWKDLGTLQLNSCRWLKKHWKGYLVLTAIICGVEMIVIYRDKIKEKISDKLESRKSEEGVQ